MQKAIADEELRIKRQDESYQLLERVHEEMVSDYQKYHATIALANESVKKHGMSEEQLAFIQKKAAVDLGSSTGAARFFDSMRLRAEKLDELNKAIDAYGKLTQKTAQEITDAKAKAEKEIMKRQTSQSRSDVAALQRGTTAAYEAERRMKNDQQKQTEILAKVENEEKKSNAIAASNNAVLNRIDRNLETVASNTTAGNRKVYDA